MAHYNPDEQRARIGRMPISKQQRDQQLADIDRHVEEGDEAQTREEAVAEQQQMSQAEEAQRDAEASARIEAAAEQGVGDPLNIGPTLRKMGIW